MEIENHDVMVTSCSHVLINDRGTSILCKCIFILSFTLLVCVSRI